VIRREVSRCHSKRCHRELLWPSFQRSGSAVSLHRDSLAWARGAAAIAVVPTEIMKASRAKKCFL
jgi:hypothetical protein